MIEDWDDYQGQPSSGEAEYIVAKNRNGGLVRNIMGFESKFTNFYDLEEPKLNHIALPPTDAITGIDDDEFHPFEEGNENDF